MSKDRAKPADVLLDMLRGAPDSGRSAAYLIDTGRLFGFPENTIRVTLSRLLARELVENPERGRYRLAATADPLNEFVERWRLGEARVTVWQPGQWLLAHVETLSDKAHWILDAFGFREVRRQLFARPDNLADALDETWQRARRIGLPADVLVIQAKLDASVTHTWMPAWETGRLNREYRTLTARLKESQARLTSLPVDAARLECFKLGGTGIHMLAKDPLLPAEFVDVLARKALHTKMIEYDTAGKAIWSSSRRENTGSLPIPRLASIG